MLNVHAQAHVRMEYTGNVTLRRTMFLTLELVS